MYLKYSIFYNIIHNYFTISAMPISEEEFSFETIDQNLAEPSNAELQCLYLMFSNALQNIISLGESHVFIEDNNHCKLMPHGLSNGTFLFLCRCMV